MSALESTDARTLTVLTVVETAESVAQEVAEAAGFDPAETRPEVKVTFYGDTAVVEATVVRSVEASAIRGIIEANR